LFADTGDNWDVSGRTAKRYKRMKFGNSNLARTAALALAAGAAMPLFSHVPAFSRQPLAVSREALLCVSAPLRENEPNPVDPVILANNNDPASNFGDIGNAWELASGADCRTARGWGEGILGVIGMAALSADAAFNLVPGKAAASTAIKTGIKELAEAGGKALVKNADGIAQAAAKGVPTQFHHNVPKFLGGDADQVLTPLGKDIHGEFHSLLRANLKESGIPLNVGGRGGGAADWVRYFNANPGAQRAALDMVLDTARTIDYQRGTRLTHDVWQNILGGNFTIFP
jgi:hypothetical protein